MNWKRVGVVVVAIAAVALVYTATAHPLGWNYGYGMMGYGMPMMGYGYQPAGQSTGNYAGFNGDFYNWLCPIMNLMTGG
ncbi:hypothetical protein Asulf_02169 [Archaeoglobus sulfaticallidus PM70-1]|uniref:Uncharacterized protein n=1 Tax=Archaeoglobus sulfaticallidus PM70-1 TaxID=387631 RepID=N0BGJ2_9EURY|nr:hypothetical protein [Archaeoglobus sulfaticallidus]AGK62123.1 hypothetical protein Asulf_02169 [Archaeoglobus sulfaticallidus PM70-1]